LDTKSFKQTKNTSVNFLFLVIIFIFNILLL